MEQIQDSTSSLACTRQIPITVRTTRLMCKWGFSSGRKGNESLTRPSDAVRHEARPVDTLRFVASHPRCRVFYLPRIQLSRGPCSNDRFRFIFRRPAPHRVGCRVLDLVNDPVAAIDTFWPHSTPRQSENNRATLRREWVLGKRSEPVQMERDKRGFFVLIYARRSSGHY